MLGPQRQAPSSCCDSDEERGRYHAHDELGCEDTVTVINVVEVRIICKVFVFPCGSSLLPTTDKLVSADDIIINYHKFITDGHNKNMS